MKVFSMQLLLIVSAINISTSVTPKPHLMPVTVSHSTTPLHTYPLNTTVDYETKNGEQYCKSNPQSRSAIHMSFQICVVILALAGNICVTVGISFSRILRSRPTNYFVVSLAISDIAICCFVMPIQISGSYRNQSFCFSKAICLLHVITDVVVHVASVTNLVLIAIDRFIAVIYPYKYRHFITERTALGLISIAWGYALLWGCLSVIKWDDVKEYSIRIYHTPQPNCVNYNPIYYTAIYSSVYLIPLVFIGFMYAKVLREAIKHARAIAALEVITIEDRKKQRNNRRQNTEMKATKTVMIVYGTFLICWLPICIITISSNWCPLCWRNFRSNHETLFYFTYLAFGEILPPLNSTLNPFIYVLFGKQFRAAFKLVFLRMIGSRLPLEEVHDHISTSQSQRRLTLQRILRKKSSTVAVATS